MSGELSSNLSRNGSTYSYGIGMVRTFARILAESLGIYNIVHEIVWNWFRVLLLNLLAQNATQRSVRILQGYLSDVHVYFVLAHTIEKCVGKSFQWKVIINTYTGRCPLSLTWPLFISNLFPSWCLARSSDVTSFAYTPMNIENIVHRAITYSDNSQIVLIIVRA